MSFDSTDPSNLFGGTWEQIKDTFLLACGDTYSAGSTGGEATHTLTTDEMPAHYHRPACEYGVPVSDTSDMYNPGSSSAHYLQVAGVSAGTAKTVNANPTDTRGSSQAHNNMPPYIGVYVWKRVA